jgi:uncharacterized protein YbjT (DUF2867 family)
MKTALIIGSTGLIGSQLLDILLESAAYNQVIAFVKRDTGKTHSKLTQHIIDFENPESYQNLVVGDDFFCTIGTTIKKAGSKIAFKKVDFGYPQAFATFALKNSVKQFLLISSIGADKSSGNFYMKTKGEIESYLSHSNFDSVSVLRPSLLLGHRNEFRLGEKIVGFFMTTFSFMFSGSTKKYKPIESENVAKALFRIAQNNKNGFSIYESDKVRQIGN